MNLYDRLNEVDTELSKIEVMIEIISDAAFEMDIESVNAEKKLEHLAIALDSIKTLQKHQRKEVNHILDDIQKGEI